MEISNTSLMEPNLNVHFNDPPEYTLDKCTPGYFQLHQVISLHILGGTNPYSSHTVP
jgi:hypothetical protein